MLAPPTSFNHAFPPFSCHNHALHIVRIILLITQCQKGCKLRRLSIGDTHILQIYIGYEDNHLWLWAKRSTVYGEFCKILMTKHCSISTTGYMMNTFLSHSCLQPCFIPSHNYLIAARSLSIWRVRQLFKWENVAWYWITALFLHMHTFFTVNLSFLCLGLWEDKFRHLHLENSSMSPRQ